MKIPTLSRLRLTLILLITMLITAHLPTRAQSNHPPITPDTAYQIEGLGTLGATTPTAAVWDSASNALWVTAESAVWRIDLSAPDPLPERITEAPTQLHDILYIAATQTFLAAADDGRVYWWALGQGDLREPGGNLEFPAPITHLRANPTQDRLVIATETTLSLWQTDGLTLIADIPITPIERLIYTPDGAWLIGVMADNTVNVWVAATLEYQTSFTAVTDPIQGLAFSPTIEGQENRNQVALADADFVYLLNFGTGNVDAVVRSPETITGLAWTPIGIFTLNNQTLTAYQSPELTPLLTYNGHTDTIQSLVPMGADRLATLSADGTVRLWQADQPDPVLTFSFGGTPISALAFGPFGDVATGNAAGEIILWQSESGGDLTTLRPSRVMISHLTPIVDLVFRTEGDVLFSAAEDGIMAWYLGTEQPTPNRIDLADEAPIAAIALSPDETELAALQGQNLLLWEIGDPLTDVVGERRVFPFDETLTALVVDPTAVFILIGTESGQILLWDRETRAVVGQLNSHTDRIHALAFQPETNALLSVGADGKVILWDVATQTELLSQGIGTSATSISWLPDGQLFLTTDSAAIRVWDGATLGVRVILNGHLGAVNRANSPDGRQILSTGQDGTLRVWGIPDPALGPDYDLDGIADALDVCPQAAGLPPSGCPDSDGDGVPDHEDQCPDGAGLPESGGCIPLCGNGIVEPGETCDPPNGDTCDPLCQMVE